MGDSIRCPNCEYEIEVSAVLSAQLRDELRREYEQRTREAEQKLTDRESKVKEAEAEIRDERDALDEEIHSTSYQPNNAKRRGEPGEGQRVADPRISRHA